MIKNHLVENENVKPNTNFQEELRRTLPNFFLGDIHDEDGYIVERGKFDVDKFLNALKENDVDELSSGYHLNFIGKDYARRQTGEKSTTVVIPDLQNNLLNENIKSRNVFLTGDNIEVLRHLQNNYSGCIDLIYIDPPYNTGSDGFIYPDKFEYGDETLKNLFGLNDEDLRKLKSIQGKATHSAWLTFMYPRICLAKKLLKENGTIFISIDDNEQANLKLMMDEIFGEGNLISVFPRLTSPQRFAQEKNVNISHDYVVVYSKSNVIEFSNINLGTNEKKELLSDAIGHYYEGDTKAILAPLSQGYSKGGDYDFEFNGKVYSPVDKNGKRNRWFWTRERMIAAAKLGILRETKQTLRMQIYQDKKFEEGTNIMVDKEEGVRAATFDLMQNKFSNPNGISDLEKLGLGRVFSNPKPVDLIKFIIRLSSTEKNTTILDFFAGSGTTAEAVMQLNNEDGGQRQFILVQLPEATYTIDANGNKVPNKGSEDAFNAGFLSIDQISRERIRRASKKILEGSGLVLNDNFDGGFKHFYVTTPAQPTLNDIDTFDKATGMFINTKGQLTQMTQSGFDNMIEVFSSESLGVIGGASGVDTILTTWMIEDGYSLDVVCEKINIGGYMGYYVDNTRMYLINENWGSTQCIELLNKIGTYKISIQTIVLYGYSFGLESIRELELGIKQLTNKVNIVKRY